MRDRGTRKLFGLMLTAAALVALPATAAAQETQRSDTAGVQDTNAMGRAQMDTTGQDSTKWGHDTSRDPEVQNPPGYRGMERPVNVFPPDSGADTATAGAVEDRATGTYDDSTWNDSTGAAQNPAGYRGMERPAARDTGATGATDTGNAGAAKETTGGDTAGADTTRVGETTPKVPKDAVRRLPAARGDTTGQSSGTGDTGTGADTTTR